MISFADHIEPKRDLFTSGISSAFSGLTGPKAMPKIDYSGNKPISAADIKDLTNYGQKLGALSAMAPAGRNSPKHHSLFGDAARAANPLSLGNLAAMGLAAAGLPGIAMAVSAFDTARNFVHAPAHKNMAPTIPRDNRLKPPSSSYGYFAKADHAGNAPQAQPYSSWADMVAPVTTMTAPAVLPFAKTHKTPAPAVAAAHADEKFQTLLKGHMREFEKIQNGVGALTKGPTMDALAPNMMTETTMAHLHMDGNAMNAAVRNKGRVSLFETGISKEQTDKLGHVDFKPNKAQQMALTFG